MAARPCRLPRISVVVPSYNQGHFLNDALGSIFRQEYPDLEVVVIDGGSTDNSVAVIKSYASWLKYWQSEKDGGQSAAINAGMRHCTGDLVAWLNSDDVYWQDALWHVGRAFAEFPGYGLYVGNGLRLDQNTGAYTPFCSRHVAFDRAALLHGTDYLLQPSTFFLREAWEAVRGLDLHLGFCMDWDIFIRIGRLYPAVTIQEFLGVSREYETTKTRSGKMKRAAEIVRMVQKHTTTEITPGSMLFLLETLVGITGSGMPEGLQDHVRAAQQIVARHLSIRYGGGHGFPEQSDPQDKNYLPFASVEVDPRAATADSSLLPTISVITPSPGTSNDLQETLDSIRMQQYCRTESLVIDGYLNDAGTINRGLAQARGDVLGWLNPSDLLAEGALYAVARAFVEDPDLEMVYGNAVSIDADGQMVLADHGPYLSGLWLGAWQKPGRCPGYGSDVYAVPQPTVFFRRRLLDRHGALNGAYPHIHEYELFTRFAKDATIKKLERILALCRIRTWQPESWNEMLDELYRLSRPQWPSVFSRQFPGVLHEFLVGFLRRKFAGVPGRLRVAAAATLVAASAITRIGSPERWWKYRLPMINQESPPLRLPPTPPRPPRCFGVKQPKHSDLIEQPKHSELIEQPKHSDLI